jgi:hypothetical protein
MYAGGKMPENETVERAREDAREGKSPSTQAGEFVREEMDHIREGKHGAVSTKQAIAIGLSKARRAGVELPPPKPGKASPRVRKKAEQDISKAKSGKAKSSSPTRSRAISGVLKKEGHSAASPRSLSRQATQAARKRGPAARHEAAMKAVRTKGKTELRTAAKKAARTQARHSQ